MSEKECAAVALAKMLADYEEKALNRQELKNWVTGFSRDINMAVENLKKGA